MNGFAPPPSDDDLQSFVDGEMQADRRAALETFLKKSPVHAERVEDWRRQRERIRAAFASVAAEPAPEPVLPPPRAGRHAFLRLLRGRAGRPSGDLRAVPHTPSTGPQAGPPPARPRAGQLVSAAAIFAAGALTALGGAFVADRVRAPPVAVELRTAEPASADDIMAQRAIAALVDRAPPDRGREAANAASAAPGKSVRATQPASLIVPNLASAGFTLAGMRAAPARSGEPDDDMFCLFYAKPAEPTVALCIAPDRDGGEPGLFRIGGKFPQDGFGAAISWRQAHAIYALAGPLSEVRLRNLATRVSAAIEAFD
jgi:anti-sigma factor RsiW